MKLLVVKDIVDGKDIVFVDDLIVWGIMIKCIVKMFKDLGVNCIYVRIVFFEFMFFSFYGIDVFIIVEFILVSKFFEEIKNYIGVDFFVYLSVDGLIEFIGFDYDVLYYGLCVESFIGDYLVGFYDYEKNYKKYLSEC